jgi:hypothetical protein
MKIKTFDRTNLRALSADINAALQAVATQYGISLSYKSARFSPSNAAIKIEAAVLSASGKVESRERVDFTQYAFMFNLNPSWLDKTFKHGGDTYTITGLATRKRKNPVLALSSRNNKTYIFPADTIKVLMEAASK